MLGKKEGKSGGELGKGGFAFHEQVKKNRSRPWVGLNHQPFG